MKVILDLDQDELDWIIDAVKDELEYNQTKYNLNEDERFIWGLNIEGLNEIIEKLEKARNDMPPI